MKFHETVQKQRELLKFTCIIEFYFNIISQKNFSVQNKTKNIAISLWHSEMHFPLLLLVLV